MIRLDSILLKCSIDCVESVNENQFFNLPTIKGDRIMRDKYLAESSKHGLKNISFSDHSGFLIDCSAKILGNDYYRSISYNTFGQLIERINESDIISLDAHKVYQEAEILRADITTNIELDNDLDKYLDALSLLSANTNYFVKRTNRATNKGIELRRRATSYKERMIFYAKLLDMCKSANESFLKLYPKALSKFTEQTLRAEQNITSMKAIRQKLNIQDNKLRSVLNSSINPNAELFDRISGDYRQLALFDGFEDCTISQVRNYFGYRGIFDRLDWDLDAVYAWIRQQSNAKNITRYKREYREVFYKLKSMRDSSIKQNEYLREIATKLIA